MSEHAELIARLRNVRRLDPGGTELLPEPWAMEAAKALSSSQAEIERLQERLEITHAWQYAGDGEDLKRIEIPPAERAAFPDGITARNATIKLQDERIARQEAEIERLKAALKELEAANEDLCLGRSQKAYKQMLLDGQTDALLRLDDARRSARSALSGQPGESA